MNKVLVIIPTYNEIGNIKAILQQTLSLSSDFSILVIDDSSPDGTGKEVKKLMVDYPSRLFLEEREKKQGLGKAYLHGFRWAMDKEFDFIFEMDADFSHNPKELLPMAKTLELGSDIVVGSRYSNGVNVINWPLSRILLSMGATFYVRLITRLPLTDSTSGFVGYKKEVLKCINLDKIKFVGYAFQIEMKYRTWKMGAQIKEHPIIFTNREKGESKMNTSIIWEAVFGVFYLKLSTLFKSKSKL